MYFESDYDKREFLGREALIELKNKYPKIFPFPIFFATDKFSPYDACFIKTDDHGTILQRVKIEIKIRDRVFPDYILEPRKLKSIRKNCDYLNDDEVTILYLNFTPENTIIWNITDMDSQDSTKLMANKATSDSRTNKVNKDVIMLNPEDGIRLNYIIDPEKIIREHKSKELKKKEVKTKLKNKGINW
jgi:hypothetical protein